MNYIDDRRDMFSQPTQLPAKHWHRYPYGTTMSCPWQVYQGSRNAWIDAQVPQFCQEATVAERFEVRDDGQDLELCNNANLPVFRRCPRGIGNANGQCGKVRHPRDRTRGTVFQRDRVVQEYPSRARTKRRCGFRCRARKTHTPQRTT